MRYKITPSILALILLLGVCHPHSFGACHQDTLRPVAHDEVNKGHNVVGNEKTAWLSPDGFVNFIRSQQDAQPAQLEKQDALGAIGHMDGLLDKHHRAITDVGELDLMADLNLTSATRTSLGQIAIVDFEREDSTFEHVYAIYGNGQIIGYGIYSIALDYGRVFNFRLTILEHTGEGNGYAALKLILNIIYQRYATRGTGLNLIEMPPFSRLSGKIYEYAWNTQAPLFFVSSGFEPKDLAGAMATAQIAKLREEVLSIAERDVLNERLFGCALMLRLNPIARSDEKQALSGPVMPRKQDTSRQI